MRTFTVATKVVLFAIMCLLLQRASAQQLTVGVPLPLTAPKISVPQDGDHPADPAQMDPQFWIQTIWPPLVKSGSVASHVPETLTIRACNLVDGVGATDTDTLCVGNFYPGPGNLQNLEAYRLWTHMLMHMMFDFNAQVRESDLMEGQAEARSHWIYQSLGFTGDTDLYTADLYNNLPANAIAGQFFMQQWINRYLATGGMYETAAYALGGFKQLDEIRYSIPYFPGNEHEYFSRLNSLSVRIDGVGVGTYLSHNAIGMIHGTPGQYLVAWASDGLPNGDRQQTPVNPRAFMFQIVSRPGLSKPPQPVTYPNGVVKYSLEDSTGNTLYSSTMLIGGQVLSGVASADLNVRYASNGRYVLRACVSLDGGKTCSADPNFNTRFPYLILQSDQWQTGKMFVLHNGQSSLRLTDSASGMSGVSINMLAGVAVVSGGEGKNIPLTDGTNTCTLTWPASLNHISPIKLWCADKLDQPIISATINSFRTDSQEIMDTINGVRATAIAPDSYVRVMGWGLYPGDPAGPGATQTSLDGTEVWLSAPDGDHKMPLWNMATDQIDFYVPADFSAFGPAMVRVKRNGTFSNPWPVTIQPVAPGLLMMEQSNTNLISAFWLQITPDSPYPIWQLATQSNPAPAGNYAILYGTGLGPTVPGDPNGPRSTTMPTSVILTNGLGGDLSIIQPLSVYYAGLAPGWNGLYQINVLLPHVSPGLYGLTIQVGDQTSNLAVIPIGNPATP